MDVCGNVKSALTDQMGKPAIQRYCYWDANSKRGGLRWTSSLSSAESFRFLFELT